MHLSAAQLVGRDSRNARTSRPSFPAPSAREKPRTTAAVGLPQIALADEAATAVQRRVILAVCRGTPVVPPTAQSLLPTAGPATTGKINLTRDDASERPVTTLHPFTSPCYSDASN